MNALGIKLYDYGIRVFGLLNPFGRKIYYAEIVSVRLEDGLLRIELAHGEALKVRLPSSRAELVHNELDSIVNPEFLSSPVAVPFDSIEKECMGILGSRGLSVKNTVLFIAAQAVCHEASDIHMEFMGDELTVSFRRDGMLFDVATFDKAIGIRLMNSLKVAAGMHQYYRNSIQEGRISLPAPDGAMDIRVSVMPSPPYEKAALRVFDKLKGASTIDTLGFSDNIRGSLDIIARHSNGLFLISGPSNSGKSTTLYSILRRIRETRGRLCKIITFEDPIECNIEGITQVQVDHRELTYEKLLSTAVRQDPGVFMLGEIRDPATAEAAVRAALTGHLVLSTVHASSSAETITRLFEMGLSPSVLASTLKGVLCQRLIRNVCPECSSTVTADPEAVRMLYGETDSAPGVTIKGLGCPACLQTGYRGRTAVGELMKNGTGVSQCLATGASHPLIEDAAKADGMQTLVETGRELVERGKASLEEIARVTA